MSNILRTITANIIDKNYDIKTMDISTLYRTFGRVLILCLKNDKQHINNYTLISSPISIIKNTFIKDLLIIQNYDYLIEHFNIDRTYFSSVEQKELILNLSNIEESSIHSFLHQFDGVTTFNDYIVASLLDNFMVYTYLSEQVRTNRINMLQTMHERTYWSLYNNCKLNISLQFMQRGFNLHLTNRIENNKIKDIISKINSVDAEDDNYLNYIYRKQVYVDASSNLQEKGYKLYRITTNLIYEKMSMGEFNKFIGDNVHMTDKEFYYLVMNMLSSKELCHYIVNNREILERLSKSDFYSKYYYVFKYFLSYAWITLYLEESIKKRNINRKDRFIFDIHTAALLPDTPIKCENLFQDSAYLPFLVSKQLYNATNNIMGVELIQKHDIRYGVCDYYLCKTRLNLFISGLVGTDLFENLNWNNIAVSGSIMACCLPNFNPLMLNFMSENDIKQGSSKFINYINEYYRDADIDMLCNLDGIPFIDKVYDVVSTLETNITKKCNPNVNDLLVVIKPVKTVAIIINADFIKKYIVSSELTYGEIIVNVNDIRVKKVLYPLYIEYKIKKNKEWMDNPNNADLITNNKYSPEFDIVSVEQLQIIFGKTKQDKLDAFNKFKESNPIKNDKKEDNNDEEDDDENDVIEKIKEELISKSLIDETNILFIINENLKFKISSPYLPHSIEMFKIKFDDYFATVASFHLPIVRSYYNGSTVRMTPSCITACMTMTNIDYKYFAGSKDPIEIINKYRCRGYGTILNDKEKVRFFEYNNLVEKWKKIYKLNINDTLSIQQCVGFKHPSNDIFKYSQMVYGENTNYNNVLYNNNNYSSDVSYLVEQKYKCKMNQKLIIIKDLKCISDLGFVEPMKHFIIDMMYNI